MKNEGTRQFPTNRGKLAAQLGQLEGLITQLRDLMPEKVLPLLAAAADMNDRLCPPDLIALKEAARLLDVRASTIDVLIRKGSLRCWRLPSGRRRVSRADVLALPKPDTNEPPVNSAAPSTSSGHARNKVQRFTASTLSRFGIEIGGEVNHDA